MSYNTYCNALLDASRQALLDSKALVDLIRHPQDADEVEERLMKQVRKSIEVSERLSLVATTIDRELGQHFGNAPQSVIEKFRVLKQTFMHSTSTVQNSLVTLTRLTKSTISNVYMQTGTSILQGKVDNCCKNLTTALKSMISSMEVLRKMADGIEMAANKPTPETPPITPPIHVKDEEIPVPSASQGDVLETACKTMREWVQKLVTIVLQGENGDLDYSKSFYDVGRATMNHMVKLINFAKKIGMLDEEARLKLLLFQLLSLAKSFNSNVQFTGALPDEQIQELTLVRTQFEESLWWFVKMAKLRWKYIMVSHEPAQEKPVHPTTNALHKSLPIVARPKRSSLPLPDSMSPGSLPAPIPIPAVPPFPSTPRSSIPMPPPSPVITSPSTPLNSSSPLFSFSPVPAFITPSRLSLSLSAPAPAPHVVSVPAPLPSSLPSSLASPNLSSPRNYSPRLLMSPSSEKFESSVNQMMSEEPASNGNVEKMSVKKQIEKYKLMEVKKEDESRRKEMKEEMKKEDTKIEIRVEDIRKEGAEEPKVNELTNQEIFEPIEERTRREYERKAEKRVEKKGTMVKSASHSVLQELNTKLRLMPKNSIQSKEKSPKIERTSRGQEPVSPTWERGEIEKGFSILASVDPPSPMTDMRLQQILRVANGSNQFLARSSSLASLKATDIDGPSSATHDAGIMEPAPEAMPGAEKRRRPTLPHHASDSQLAVSPRVERAATAAAAVASPTVMTKLPIYSVGLKPDKLMGLKMSVMNDKEVAIANMTLRSGVLRRAHPQSVIFDTKRQQEVSTMGVYKGDVESQLLNFRTKVNAHLDYILMDTYSLNAMDMKMLVAEKDGRVNQLWAELQSPPTDKKDFRNPPLRKNSNVEVRPFDDLHQIYTKAEIDASAELARRLEMIVQSTFDQYEGLRQINDFRSIPEVGHTVLQMSHTTNATLKKQLICGAILIVYNFLQQVLSNKDIVKIYQPSTKDEFLGVSRHEHNLQLGTDNILLEYCKLKAGLLMHTGYVSSIVEQQNGNNLNHFIVDKFLTEIYEITEHCIFTQADLFTKRATEIEKIPKKRQKVIFSKFGGKEAFGQLATDTLALLRPWMRKWVDVQVQAIVQRELFAKNVEALKIALEESKNHMVASFQELLNNQVPEPLFKFDAILKSIDEELELVSAIFSI